MTNTACVCERCHVTFLRKSKTAGRFCSRTCLRLSYVLRPREHIREERIWADIVQRCTNPKREAYKDYGGRGIRVCDRWLGSSVNFVADMGPRPSPAHTIDRIDTNGNYEPSNCRWATWTEQQRNRRNNHTLTFRGETRCVAEWSEVLGVSKWTLHSRISMGWSTERTLSEPVATGRLAIARASS